MTEDARERSAPQRRISVLPVEHGRADKLLVEELIAESGGDIGVHWAPSMARAEREMALGPAALRPLTG